MNTLTGLGAKPGMLTRRAFRPVGRADIWGDPPVAPQFSLCSNLASWMLQGPPNQPGAHSGPPPGHLPRSAKVIECQSEAVTALLKAL